jgi:hypothetical protein
MSEPYEIVHDVHDTYKGICEKLSRITGKCVEIYRSHGREPKTHNPLASGNVSAVTHYYTYVRLHEAAEPGAGVMLNNRVHADLDAEFAAISPTVPQKDIHVPIINEVCDVEKWLASFDIEQATRPQLVAFEDECSEAIDALLAAKAQARARKRLIGVVKANGNGKR